MDSDLIRSDKTTERSICTTCSVKYARDPQAYGFGIYVVFWFVVSKTQPQANEPKPRTADELEKRLRETLPSDERRKISICVINVTKPE